MKQRRPERILTAAIACALVTACAAGTAPPEWKSDASSASERFTEAWLSGDVRVEQLEFERAREETARTGRPDLVARIELLRCAVRVASLVNEPCTGFDALRGAVGQASAETAYADYLAGRVAREQIALLPEAQRKAALTTSSKDASGALRAIEDPLSRLVAAGVMYKTAEAGDAVVETAIETASAQGWQRPLLAWLIVKARRADVAGDPDAARRTRQRIELVAPKQQNRPKAGGS